MLKGIHDRLHIYYHGIASSITIAFNLTNYFFKIKMGRRRVKIRIEIFYRYLKVR